ncbi:response regulator transcription factor [Streptomyces sp. NBC_01190]|uniref:helix-turn-helix transcriptional regulator n=1 Tax=Streptomyces sp. NBC_01190 TaxID=2903767 RepID=UPI0038681226|nr:LuxR C-terminal-related transcriptional regulator [Streptomyces sp. NBC_01190]
MSEHPEATRRIGQTEHIERTEQADRHRRVLENTLSHRHPHPDPMVPQTPLIPLDSPAPPEPLESLDPSDLSAAGATVLPLVGRRLKAPVEESPVAVAVRATDRVTESGARAWLRGNPRIAVLPAERERAAEVALFLATQVNEGVFGAIKRHHTRLYAYTCPLVVVADAMSESQLLAAADFGMVRFLPRGAARFTDIVAALADAPTEWSNMPGTSTRRLVRELRKRQAADASGVQAGLRPREVQILRLLAEGIGTAEIAGRLSYSERTIKGVLHELTHRLGLRNRTQAVAYGIRAGVV